MKSVTFFNRKGGVGKTTICALLSRFYGEIGKKVLCIDLDSQMNLTSYCSGYNDRKNVENSFRYTIADVINGEEDININAAIYPAGEYDEDGNLSEKNTFTNLFFIPGTIAVDAVNKNLSNDLINLPQFILQSKLRELDDSWDIVMQDCSPGENLLTIMSLVSSDFVLKPIQPEIHSLNGAIECNYMISTIQRKMNSQLKDLGCVINCYKERESLSKFSKEMLEKDDFSGLTIRNTSKVPTAMIMKDRIVNTEKYLKKLSQDKVAEDFIALGEYILRQFNN